jgi:hypothetical protein
LEDVGNALKGHLQATNEAVKTAKEKGEYFEAGRAMSDDPMLQMTGLGDMAALAGLSRIGKAAIDGPLNTVLKSSRTGKLTGIDQFDRLFSESPQAQKMIAGLERRNVSIIDDVTMLKPGESAFVTQIDGCLTLVYDSKSTSFMDMLHESRHVAQVQRVESAGVLGNKSIFDPNGTRLRGASERGAYEYELRLGNRFNFSDEYMSYAKHQIDFYYPKSYSSKFSNSPTMNAIFKAIEPGLKP